MSAAAQYVQIINRDAIREGDVISRRGTALISRAIMLATGGKWSHDAIIIRSPYTGALCVGDAIGGRTNNCQFTPLVEWEDGCLRDGHRIIVLRPTYATVEQGQRAAAFWTAHVAGMKYDKVAIFRLALKMILGDWLAGQVGMLSRFYCTEGCIAAWQSAGLDPWWPKSWNATPRTTQNRWEEGRFCEVADALTEAGKRYRVRT